RSQSGCSIRWRPRGTSSSARPLERSSVRPSAGGDTRPRTVPLRAAPDQRVVPRVGRPSCVVLRLLLRLAAGPPDALDPNQAPSAPRRDRGHKLFMAPTAAPPNTLPPPV